MKDGGREYENGGVDEKGEHEGEAGIDGGEFDRLAFSFRRPLEIARLHDGGVQVEVMRHDGCAQDADAHVEHILIFRISVLRTKAEHHAREAGLGEKELDRRSIRRWSR